jgi:hypothetical protein
MATEGAFFFGPSGLEVPQPWDNQALRGAEVGARSGQPIVPARLRFGLYAFPDGSYIPGTGMSFRRR